MIFPSHLCQSVKLLIRIYWIIKSLPMCREGQELPGQGLKSELQEKSATKFQRTEGSLRDNGANLPLLNICPYKPIQGSSRSIPYTHPKYHTPKWHF